MQRALRGSCACGRNQYVVEIPQTSSQTAQVLFDNSSVNRHHQAAPFTAWLRVPLSWYHSGTIAFFPDETHRSIRRTFTSPPAAGPAAAAASQRQFCGYCGTQLTSWHERTRDDADHIAVTLGSLRDDDLGRLEEWGVLAAGGEDEDEDDDDDDDDGARTARLQGQQIQQAPAAFSPSPSSPSTHDRPQQQQQQQQQQQPPPSLFRPVQGAAHRGAPWFEALVEDGRLGRIKRQRGGRAARDGTVAVEWEVVEWTGGAAADEVGAAGGAAGKRKFADAR